ncbi:vitamin B12 dependent-methionine synthase activation domain-containing protein [Eubacterium oxidoreducens]|uniref:Vitamin B12 dependent methionine synthase, activation domain n=1 Tax=Eubacterium oxidoreducens TaxID=1732 RepID=A0A1G6AW12_EUBOX|nr:vitamin B12 dependent-methionine synthase activation domain-containing protein [Eubacterium oxidoreducens]SDB12597.1 Vitamin B12 dependent methionine synthase, activation domain [Eubacterium oxidoreducens]
MEARLSKLNENEILMYLGHRGQEITDEIKAQITSCIRQVEEVVTPRLVYRIVPLEDGKTQEFLLDGNDVARELEGCNRAVFLAVTLGNQIEQLLMKLEIRNLADAVIMDAVASVAVENICNNFEQDLRVKVGLEGEYLTSRFSPGYGDLPLTVQGQWCNALNTEKRIGLVVTTNHLMIPRKSVTAVMGISDTPQKLRPSGCETCNMFRNCEYRKDGKHCHE